MKAAEVRGRLLAASPTAPANASLVCYFHLKSWKKATVESLTKTTSIRREATAAYNCYLTGAR